MTTQGVYHLAKRVMNCSVLAFFAEAFSTSSRIFVTVDSPKGFVTLTSISPLRLTQPLITSSPSASRAGTLSPVRAEVSAVVFPETITPSRGIFSPALTTIISPVSTVSGGTCSTPSPRFTEAMSGRISIRDETLFRDRLTAQPCKVSPSWYSIITATPSGYSPIKNAPSEATAIRKHSSKGLPRRIFFPAVMSTSRPIIKYAAKNIQSARLLSRKISPAIKTAADTAIRTAIILTSELSSSFADGIDAGLSRSMTSTSGSIEAVILRTSLSTASPLSSAAVRDSFFAIKFMSAFFTKGILSVSARIFSAQLGQSRFFIYKTISIMIRPFQKMFKGCTFVPLSRRTPRVSVRLFS